MTTTTAPDAGTRSADRTGWAALLVVWLVWGSTYLAIRVGVRTMPPFTLAAIRYLVAGAIMLPLGWFSGTAEQRVTDRPGKRQWAAMLLLGAMLPAAGNGVVSWAEVTLSSGIAALLIGTVPIWMVLADGVLSRKMPGLARWLALGVGLAGVVVLSGGGSGPVAAFAIVAALLAAVSWGVGSALQTRLPVPKRPLLMSGMELLCGGLVLTVVAAGRGELTFALDHVSAESWWALLYLIGPGSLLAMTCYVYALDRLPATTVSTYAFVNPVVAVLLGLVILGEHITTGQAVGGGLVVMAVAGLLVAPRRRLPSPP
ncbi:MAG: EamA family transporter [Actinomycetota bacterium]|nr:EamA family transporter [Actinomycetota bacterium]